MNLEDLSLKTTSLLRKTGLAQVSKPVIVGVIMLGLVLVLIGIWHFWPRAHADFSSSQATAVQGAESEFRASNSLGSASAAAETNGTKSENSSTDEIMIDVEGAVASPGLYALAPDARIGDAIEAAGGMAADALPGSINLAQKLTDGDQVYVPSVQDQESQASGTVSTGASGAAQGASGALSAQQSASGKININTASADELQQLSGIGPSLSQRIVEHRQSNGRFSSIEDLKNVSGIGDAKFASIKDKICV